MAVTVTSPILSPDEPRTLLVILAEVAPWIRLVATIALCDFELSPPNRIASLPSALSIRACCEKAALPCDWLVTSEIASIVPAELAMTFSSSA